MITTFSVKTTDEARIICLLNAHFLNYSINSRITHWVDFRVNGDPSALLKLFYILGEMELEGFLFENLKRKN